jgi:hypothetical protein
MLKLAGREADIVGILTTSVATGTVVDMPSNRIWDTVEQQIGYVREGAGDRFDQIELSTVGTVIVTDDRRGRTEQMIRENGWQGVTVEDVWRMPAVYIGSVDQIVTDLDERRERLGVSYIVVASARVEAVAPIVARLAGS